MTAPILVIIALLTALTGALLDNSRRAATIALHDTVGLYAELTIAAGSTDFTHGLGEFIAAHGTAGPWPSATSRSALKSTCVTTDAACPFAYRVSARITGASEAGPAAGSDAAANVQAAAIGEQRLSAVVTTTVVGRDGSILGSRTRLLTYRIFGTAPYAIVSGVREPAATDGTPAAAPGDSGGAAGTAAVADTRIHLRLTCSTAIDGVVPFANDQQPRGNDGLPWGNAPGAAYETPCALPDAAADAFENERWTNGDTNPSGWTP